MTSHLTPEQRPDKNGNIVTRWVRGIFEPRESARNIPQVTIDVGPQPMPRREAKEIYNRLMATMPEGDVIETLADADQLTLRKLDDRRILGMCFDMRKYHLLPLFETFGDTHSYDTVKGAAETLQTKGIDAELTDETLTAYVSMRLAIRKAILKSQEEEGVSLPEVFLSTVDLPSHVLVHPEDTPILSGIIGQGVSDKEKILQMLTEIKEGRLARAISDGFL
jgi:hypothetical protein